VLQCVAAILVVLRVSINGLKHPRSYVQLYNGWAVLPADLGMLYQYNKLIGGVLITQKRGKEEVISTYIPLFCRRAL